MPQAFSKPSNDPFSGLLLPIEAWKALDAAHITNLEQLKDWAPLTGQMPSFDPEAAQIIKDRLARLAARRTVRVRLIFPKRHYRTAEHK